MFAWESHSRMRSSRKLTFSTEAESDFEVLLAYSLATWGAEQRDAYADRLSTTLFELLKHPLVGRSRDELGPGLRIRRSGKHAIYYRSDEQTVTIVRILHVKMDPMRHPRRSQ